MQQERPEETRSRSHFHINYFEKWEQFMTFWKPVKFGQSLNNYDEKALTQFWQKQLTALEAETEKIAILVPVKVKKDEVKEEKVENTQSNGNVKEESKVQEITKKQVAVKEKSAKQQKINRNNKNFVKKEGLPMVKLNKKVVEVAVSLLKEKFTDLKWMYESLFMGNDKQLFIYRNCASMVRYLERYRLPKDFKQRFEHLNSFAEEIYDQKIESNRAISGYARPEVMKSIQDQLKQKRVQLLEEFCKFKPYFIDILNDFKEKESAKEIIMLSARSEVIPLIEPLVKDVGYFINNRFYYVEGDEVKDMIIQKIHYDKIEQFELEQEEPKPERKIVYIAPPKQDEVPKDIMGIQLQCLDLKKQCFVYKIKMPSCSKYNQFQGLFFRAPEGEGPYQLTMLIDKEAQEVQLEFYPYDVGKLKIDIYIWNHVGFTKSTQKIVIYNELEVKGKCPPLKNYAAWMVGTSNFGVRTDTQNNLKQYKIDQKYKDLSIYNSVIGCDSYGNCAAWGQLYYTENHEDEPTNTMEQINQHFFKNQRIQPPSLVFNSNKFVRKVSCGLGFALMLTSLGELWSYGFNKLGQLGQGNFSSNYYSTEPQQVCKFTGETSCFLTDICATSKGSSFAVDDRGRLYRWGYNQVEETHLPVFDRFNTIVNYQTGQVLYKNAIPSYIGKNHINGYTKQIEVGDEHYYVLTKEGDLYGWGIVEFLGCGELKDPQDLFVFDIVNPITLMSDIESVSTNQEHTIVMTKSGEIYGWGRAQHFSKIHKNTQTRPVNLTKEFQGQGEKRVKMIKAGFNYTILVRQNNEVQLFGGENILEVDQKTFTRPIVDVICSKKEENFVILVDE